MRCGLPRCPPMAALLVLGMRSSLGPRAANISTAAFSGDLDLIGLDSDHPMIGRDLLAMAPGVPGHAFMQYDATNAYRVGDRVVVHQPFSAPQQFRYRKGRLVPAALDPELRSEERRVGK